MAFPDDFVTTLKTHIETVMTSHTVLLRPVRFTDPSRSVSLFVVNWQPDEGEHLIGQVEPATARYIIRIQNFVKAADETEARSLYAVDSKTVRAILYRSDALRLAFSSLSETFLGSVERVQRYGVAQQNFLNNELKGQFVYIATTDLWVETEITKL